MFPNLLTPNFGASLPSSNPLRMPRSPWDNLRYNREQEVEQEAEQEDPIISHLREIQLRKQGPAMQKYEDYLNRGVPQEGERSILAKAIAAISSGIGAAQGDGNAVSRNLQALRMPYERDLERYELEGNGLGAAAEFEQDRANQDIATVKLMDEIRNRDLDNQRADETARLARERFGLEAGREPLTRQNIQSQIDARGWSTQRNNVTGQLEAVNVISGETRPLGKFDISYDQKQADEQNIWEKRNQTTFGQQRSLQSSGSANALSNAIKLKGIPQATNSQGDDTLSAAAQANAREQALEEILNFDKDFNDLISGDNPIIVREGGKFTVRRPQDLDDDAKAELEMRLQNLNTLAELRKSQILNAKKGSRFIRGK